MSMGSRGCVPKLTNRLTPNDKDYPRHFRTLVGDYPPYSLDTCSCAASAYETMHRLWCRSRFPRLSLSLAVRIAFSFSATSRPSPALVADSADILRT